MIFITHHQILSLSLHPKVLIDFRVLIIKLTIQKKNEEKNFYPLMSPGACYDKHPGKRLQCENYGAIGNGKVLDHHAINAAIDSYVAHGGGRVVLPAGTYLCGSIRMKSHVELHLMAGSKILAAPASMKAYDEAEVLKALPIRTADILILKTASSMPSAPMMYPSRAEV